MEIINVIASTTRPVWSANVACHFTTIDLGRERPHATPTNALVFFSFTKSSYIFVLFLFFFEQNFLALKFKKKKIIIFALTNKK